MKAHHIFPFLLLIAACDAPNSPTQTSANGSTEIKLQGNLSCWDNRCMRYDAHNGSFSRQNRYPVYPPAGSVQPGGYISLAVFQQTYTLAGRASFRSDDYD
jgi:hypothetical protein